MFTGLIEGTGTIQSHLPMSGGLRMGIRPDSAIERMTIGDSIAVSGACLTVVTFSHGRFEVDVAPETLSKTTLGRARVGDRVNLELALRLGDRLGGHLVSGHVDGVGVIKAKKPVANAVLVAFEVPEVCARYIVEKGSVAVDGISLTVNACDKTSFEVSVIPHTAKVTTLGVKNAGDRVNIETDIIGKYVERFTRPFVDEKTKEKRGPAVSKTLLAESGFM